MEDLTIKEYLKSLDSNIIVDLYNIYQDKHYCPEHVYPMEDIHEVAINNPIEFLDAFGAVNTNEPYYIGPSAYGDYYSFGERYLKDSDIFDDLYRYIIDDFNIEITLKSYDETIMDNIKKAIGNTYNKIMNYEKEI